MDVTLRARMHLCRVWPHETTIGQYVYAVSNNEVFTLILILVQTILLNVSKNTEHNFAGLEDLIYVLKWPKQSFCK